MLKKLTDLLKRASGKDLLGMEGEASGGHALLAKAFTKAFSDCPICGEDLIDHYFALLSVVPTWKVEAVKDLLGKVKQYQWASAQEFREFDRTQDAIEIYVLRCPGRRLAVVTISDPYEPYHNAAILEHEVLDYERSDELRSVVGDAKWLPIK